MERLLWQDLERRCLFQPVHSCPYLVIELGYCRSKVIFYEEFMMMMVALTLQWAVVIKVTIMVIMKRPNNNWDEIRQR